MKRAQLRLLIALARFLLGDPTGHHRRNLLVEEIDRAERIVNGLTE